MASGKLWGNATQSPIEESDKASEVISQFLAGEDIPKTTTVEEERFTMDNYKEFEALCADWPSSK
jgi:ABC-type sugar transport system substrate-binding protein